MATATAGSRDLNGPVSRILQEIIQPRGYVRWEYLSRQRLLANAILGSGPGRARILDIGCGYGALALTLREVGGHEIAAMDILAERIASVAEKGRARPDGEGRVHLLIADAENSLPFKAGTFDIVVATEVLEHLDDPARTLREVHRVLRPGGRFLMTTPNAEALPYRVLHHLPKPLVARLAASLTQENLHPELLSSSAPSHPDQHRREGFALRDLADLGEACALRMVVGYTYRVPLPDKLIGWAPGGLARRLAAWGTQRIPLGLQIYCEFRRVEDAA